MAVLNYFPQTLQMIDGALHINPDKKVKTLVLTSCSARAMDVVSGLCEHQFSSRTATCFNEFRERLDQADIVIMELILPDVDGIEIIRYLGQQVNQPDLVFVSDLDTKIISAATRLAKSKGLHVRAALPAHATTEQLVQVLEQPASARHSNSGTPIIVTDHLHLRRGMAQDEFQVYFQPKIDVQTLELVSVEALVRWRHAEFGLLGANSFVELAEQTGLITPLTDIIIEKAFGYASEWHELGIPLKVAINVSGASLADLSLPDKLMESARKHELSPDNIVVEITESWVAKNSIDALDILTRLRMKGFDLSIDDFGTGYSSMLKLKQIPFSELKLDQSIIRGAADDPDSRSILETSIELGHRLGLHLVAEGVEHQDDWDLISDLGCNEGQGFFIARPMKAIDLPEWHNHWNRSLGI